LSFARSSHFATLSEEFLAASSHVDNLSSLVSSIEDSTARLELVTGWAFKSRTDFIGTVVESVIVDPKLGADAESCRVERERVTRGEVARDPLGGGLILSGV
jgi:hypothetical protein